MKTRTILSKNLDAAFSIKKVYVQIFLKHTLFVMAAAGIWLLAACCWLRAVALAAGRCVWLLSAAAVAAVTGQGYGLVSKTTTAGQKWAKSALGSNKAKGGP